LKLTSEEAGEASKISSSGEKSGEREGVAVLAVVGVPRRDLVEGGGAVRVSSFLLRIRTGLDMAEERREREREEEDEEEEESASSIPSSLGVKVEWRRREESDSPYSMRTSRLVWSYRPVHWRLSRPAQFVERISQFCFTKREPSGILFFSPTQN